MTQYAAERKGSVVRRMLESPDRPIRELSQETGISVWSLYDWRKKAMKDNQLVAGKSNPSGKQASSPKRTAIQKIAVVAETAAFNEAELAEYCRQQALREAKAVQARRIKELEREPRRKERALAETAALLTLRKKASAIWGGGEDE